jgi:hypothetical protein
MLARAIFTMTVSVIVAGNGFSQGPGGGRGPGETGGDTSLTRFTTDDFSGSGNCAFCHSGRIDNTGRDVSMDRQWRSTLMANSARDPLWQAKVSSEVARNPELREVIEDKCSRCHTPMAHVQAVAEGKPVTVLGDGFLNPSHAFHEAAVDGVSCSLCHQISEYDLGTPASFTGNYVIDTTTSSPYRRVYGSFAQPFQHPMQMNVGYTPTLGAHVNDSAFCGTCHTLYTPVIDGEGRIVGEFPEQTPYLEWQHSVFSETGENKPCQECHMPAAKGAVALSNRPPWLTGRNPVGEHRFVGGNRFLLEIMDTHGAELGVTADTDHLNTTADGVTEQLTQETAQLSLLHQDVEQGLLTVVLQVSNLAGHKFPSGVPIRRAWLHVRISDREGELVFESGKPLPDGRIAGRATNHMGTGYESHHDVITSADQVQVYETVMHDSQGDVTYTFLSAAGYLKDNRLLPEGFEKKSAGPDIAVYGSASEDQNFVGGSDTVTYQVDVRDVELPVQCQARLLYQSVGPQFMEDLNLDDTPQVERFADYYDTADKMPVEVAVTAGRIL